jgi:cyclophilin family peptidyl-prolyl cis-trans isomerase/HEAT repeat protein
MLPAVIVAAALSLVWYAPGICKSRYESLLKAPTGRAKLASLAKMEDTGAIDAAVLKPLIADREPLIRVRCAEVLGRIGDSSGVPFLVALTADKDPRVVESAVYSLGLVGDTLVLAPLGKCLAEKPAPIKERALEALGKTGVHAASRLIAPYLRNFSGTIRAQAALALAFSGDSSSAGELEASIHDPDPHVAACAIYAMGRLGYRAGAEGIADFLVHENPEVRLRSAEALGRLKAGDAASAIAPLTKDADRMVAIKAAEALSRIASRKGTSSLVALLASNDDYLKTVALGGLAAIGDRGTFEAVTPLLNNPSPMVRRAALGAAAATGADAARGFLLEALKKRTAHEKMTALELLGGMGNPADLGLLVGTLGADNDPLLREGAAAGLGNWKDPEELGRPFDAPTGAASGRTPIEALIEAADGKDWVVASIAAESLGKVGPVEIIPQLLRIYAGHGTRLDGDRKLAIVEAIAAKAPDLKPEDVERFELAAFFARACAEADPRIATASERAAARLGMKLVAAPHGRWDRGRYPWGDPSLPLGTRRIRIDTARGAIEVVLFGDDAPNFVQSIIHLAANGFYNGLTFHRVVPGFVIQGGCPRSDGWGDAGYYVRSEINLYRYGRGTFGIADSGTDTGGSQFFITHTPQPHLNGRYTIVGRVASGMNVVDTIEEGDPFTVTVIK